MIESSLPVAIVLPPLAATLLAVATSLGRPARAHAIIVAAAALSFAAAVAALGHCASGETLSYHFGGWAAPYGIAYRIDGLGAVMAVVVSGVSLAVLVYAGPITRIELSGNETPFLALCSLLVAALLGMAVTGDLFNLYVFLEIASITAYALIGAAGGAAALASFRYLLIGTIGASFYLLGLAYLLGLTGTLNMADMAARLPAAGGQPAVLVAVAFIITGLGLKMALFPMHGWLPDAYTYAPSAASALIASLMTKVAAFALLRVLYGVLWPTVAALGLPLTPFLGWAATGAIVIGSVMALAQSDLKRLLAYSSVSHLGYVGLGLALGNRDGLIGAVLHIAAHATMKGCLFLVAGGVSCRIGARSIAALEGLSAEMPVSMAAFVVAAMSMIGIPPTAGFFSKWYLLLGCLHAGQPAFAAVLLLSSLLNAWYFFRLIERIYFRRRAHGHGDAGASVELPRGMLGPIAALATAVVFIGLVNQPLVNRFLAPSVNALHAAAQGKARSERLSDPVGPLVRLEPGHIVVAGPRPPIPDPRDD